jgi:hypothetical protein
MPAVKSREHVFGWLDGASKLAEWLPDGAWLQCMEDLVGQYNYKYRAHHNPNEMVVAWVKTKNYEGNDVN